MVNPFSPIQDQINHFFPPSTHPSRMLDRRLDAILEPGHRVLEIGCGYSARRLKTLRGRGLQLHGLDVVPFDQSVEDITLVNGDVADMAMFDDGSMDVILSEAVMEHLEDAEAAFGEISRLLAPGGRYLFLTPNRYDYVSLAAQIVPNAWHGRLVHATEGRAVRDVFPTYYRANSTRRIQALAAQSGLDIDVLERLSQYPSSLKFNRVLFYLGCCYEKLLDKASALDVLKGWLAGCLVKPGETTKT